MAHDSDGHDRSQPRQGGQEQARQPRTSRAGSETRDQASDDRDAPAPGDDYTRPFFRKLDRSLLTNWGNLDPAIVEQACEWRQVYP